MPLPAAKRDFMPQLTGIRALAAWMVFVHHWSVTGKVQRLETFVHELHIGVSLFFVLSGFLIYYRYAGSFDGSSQWWRTYLKNRVARIYPMYLLLTVATLIVLHASFKAWLYNLTFLRGFSVTYLFSGIPQGWSLTVEECFYFFAPLLFFLVRKRSWMFWPLLPLIYLTGIALLLVGHAVLFDGFFANVPLVFIYTFFGRAFEFFAGMFVARVFLARSIEFQHATALAILGIAASIAFQMRLQTPVIVAGSLHPVGRWVNNFIIPLFFALLLFGLINERTWLQRFLATRPMVLFGRSSYVFYLIHIGPLRDLIVQRRLSIGGHLVEFVIMNLAAVALFMLVEEPLNRGIRRFGFWRITATPAADVA